MMRQLLTLCCLAAGLAWPSAVTAKDIKDTLYSQTGDRVIISYSMTRSGSQVTVRFNTVQKKLGQRSQDKYKKLDEVAVVVFDRTGNYKDIKFDGQATTAFMVPANVSYTPTDDGYYLLQENPALQFQVNGEDDAKLMLPLYLAHYEGKRHYKVFGQCGVLTLETKTKTGTKTGTGTLTGTGTGTETITSEELTDEGISPADEATIRISSVMQMLGKVSKLPMPEELTHEVSMLRELRFKVTDASISRKISEALDAYDSRKQELETAAESAQQAKEEEAARKAQEAQERADSIASATAEKAEKDKKDMMWLIGGIATLGILLIVGKQVFQTIKNNSVQKMQQQMQKQLMENAMKAQQAAMPKELQAVLPDQVNQEISREVRRSVSKESMAAKQKLQEMKKPKQPTAQAATPTADKPTPKKPSLNDQIPAKYKRWRKPGQSPNKNVTI